MFTGLIAKFGLGLVWGKVKTNAVHDWQAIPPKARLWLMIVIAAIALFFVHQWYAGRQLKAADHAGYQRAKDEDAKAAAAAKARAVTVTINGARIAQETRTTNDKENLSIHAAAGSLSVRGPGASRCRPVGDPALPAARGGNGTAPSLADASASAMPVPDGESDLSAVPWTWLVARAEESDLDRAEVIAWRDWYKRESAEWDKLRADAKPAH